MKSDPYRSPMGETLLDPEELGTVDLRCRFQREEVTVLAVGWFYYFLGSLLMGIAVISLILASNSVFTIDLFVYLLGFILLIVGGTYLILGLGLRRFDSWARVPAMIASLTVIVFLPIGVLASPICFVLLKNNAVKALFTAEYQTAVVAEGELLRHYGWVAVLGGLLTSISLFLLLYWQAKGFL